MLKEDDIPQDLCDHLKQWKEVKKHTVRQCEECVKTGSDWVHLRTCQTCGVTLCCDSSPNRHMTAHFQKTGHPVVISAERGEKWAWCYADQVFFEY